MEGAVAVVAEAQGAKEPVDLGDDEDEEGAGGGDRLYGAS